MKFMLTLYLTLSLAQVSAAELGLPDFVTLEQNVQAMDENGDGIVTVYEVRRFIEAKHGKHYQVQALDEMESSASGKSCGTPFAKPLF